MIYYFVSNFYFNKQFGAFMKVISLSILFAFLFILFTNLSRAEQTTQILYLKNGSVIKCNVIEFDPAKQIKIKTSDGSVYVYEANQIDKLSSDINAEQQTNNNSSNNRTSYTEFGAYILTPGGFNIGIGQWNNDIGLRFSIGSTGTIVGGEVEFGWVLYDQIKTRQSINIALAGLSTFEGSDAFFGVGPVYNLNTHGFHLETGLLVGNTTFESPVQLWLQIGYMYCFR